MKYRNTKSGEVIEVDASITGAFWEEVEEKGDATDAEPDDEAADMVPDDEAVKPKSRGRGKKA